MVHIPVVLSDTSEDWAKRTFDFYNADGTTANTIEEVGRQLAVDRRSVAIMVNNYPFPEAIPLELREECWRELRL